MTRITLHLGSARAFRRTVRAVYAALDAGAPLSIVGGGQWLKEVRFLERQHGRPAAAGERR